MRKKLKLRKETLSVLTLNKARGGGGVSIEYKNTGDDGTGGSITCSVPFCLTLYPNECATIGC